MNHLNLDLRRTGWAAVAACLIVCVACASSAWAINANEAKHAGTQRSLIQNAFTMMGFAGQNADIKRGAGGNAYPWNGNAIGAWGAALSQFTSNRKSQMYNDYKQSMGEGIWIGVNGRVSTTGPRQAPTIEEQIIPWPYDPIGGEEENWGVTNPMKNYWHGVGVGQGATSDNVYLCNYWPGIQASDQGGMYGETLQDLNQIETAPVRIANYDLYGYIADTTIPEEIIITQWIDMHHGIQVKRRVFNWSNQDFDDFYIVELEFTNTGDFDGDGAEDAPGATATLNDVYIAFKNGQVSSAMGVTEQYGWSGYAPSRAIDDIIWFSDSAGYPGVFASGYKAVVHRDSDDPIGRDWDDTGDPRYRQQESTNFDILQTEGQLTAPSTHFVAPLAYADDAGMFSFNDWDRGKYVQPKIADQPINAKMWKVRDVNDQDDPNPNENSQAEMYSIMTETGYQANPDESNPDDRKAWQDMTTYGPYDLAAGASCKIVLAWGAGHPSQMVPAPAGTQLMDPVQWDRSNASVEQKIKDMKTLGEQAAFENLQLAHFVYDANYQIPPSPTEAFIAAEDKGSSGDARQLISWVDPADRAVNPATGTADIVGYRVYRSTWFGWGPWELWDVIPKGSSGETVTGKWTYSGGRYSYEDKDSAAGFPYHWSVRPYNSGIAAWSGGGKTTADIPSSRVQGNVTNGYESGWAPPTARTYDADWNKPFQPVTAETDALSKKVLVVPNPYIKDDVHTYPNATEIRFVGIPSKCLILVYNAAGDYITRMTHDSALKGERNWNQIPDSIVGEMQTGLYYFVVVSQTAGSAGATQNGSFVLVK